MLRWHIYKQDTFYLGYIKLHKYSFLNIYDYFSIHFFFNERVIFIYISDGYRTHMIYLLGLSLNPQSKLDTWPGYQDSKKEVFSKYVLHQWTQRYFHPWSLVIRDPLLIYESNVLQTFRPGNIRKKRNQETRERDQTIDEIVEVNIPRVDLDVNDIEDEINKWTYFEVFEIIL